VRGWQRRGVIEAMSPRFEALTAAIGRAALATPGEAMVVAVR
jgi:hypothetical protein